jgi:hypothetical protein
MAKHLRCTHGMGDHSIGDEIKVSDTEAAQRLAMYSGPYKCYVQVKDLGDDEVAPEAPAPAPEAPAEPEQPSEPASPESAPEAPAARKRRGE